MLAYKPLISLARRINMQVENRWLLLELLKRQSGSSKKFEIIHTFPCLYLYMYTASPAFHHYSRVNIAPSALHH